jgi:hypothetical protein
MKKGMGISILCMVFLMGLLVSGALAVAINVPTFSQENNTDRPGMTYAEDASMTVDIEDFFKLCENKCRNDSKCKAFSFEKGHWETTGMPLVPSRCMLKAGVPSATPRQYYISAVKSDPIPQMQEPNVQREKGSLSTGPATFKVNPGLLGPPKNFYNEYYKIVIDFEAAESPIFQKITKDIAASKTAINEYLTKLNNCSNQDHSTQECNPQETVQACEQRLLATCLGSATNNVASRYSDLNADLVQLKALVDKWGPIVCNQAKSWSNIIGSIQCNW